MEVIAGKYTRQDTLGEIIKALVLQQVSLELDDLGLKSVELEILTFNNCREYGYTYAVKGGKQDHVFCVYEHRNSDQICINGCKRKDIKPYGPYLDGSKWDVLHMEDYDGYHETAKQLALYLFQSYKGAFNQALFE